jgi:hypothetical protein
MNKEFLSVETLSWRAKGILAYLLSKPDNWQVQVWDLIRQSTEGEYAVRQGIKELETHGYMERIPVKDKNYKFVAWETVVYEIPHDTKKKK